MKPSALILTVAVALVSAAPVAAQSPAPKITPSLVNPGKHHAAAPRKLTGRACTSGTMATRAQTAINPATGGSQAAPIVSIPLTNNGGGVANATTRAQQAAACAHPTH